jgi:hypothetical protein
MKNVIVFFIHDVCGGTQEVARDHNWIYESGRGFYTKYL